MLHSILQKATELDGINPIESFEFLHMKLCDYDLHDKFHILNEELLRIPYALYSTSVLMNLVGKLFYWKPMLPQYMLIVNRIWHEIVMIRGQTELGDALDTLF